MNNEPFKDAMDGLRTGCAGMVEQAHAVKTIVQNSEAAEGQDKGEMIANITLAIRHIEDAAMRFGKAIQASAGGTSPLGGPKTPGK